MDKKILRLIISIGILLASKSFAASGLNLPEKTVVIVSDNRPIFDAKNNSSLLKQHAKAVMFYNLDDVKKLEKQWSEGLPKNEVEARKVFEQRLSTIGKRNFERELKSAYQGIFYSFQHNVTRYPAIIFDDKYIVYGVGDLNDALVAYQRFKEEAND